MRNNKHVEYHVLHMINSYTRQNPETQSGLARPLIDAMCGLDRTSKNAQLVNDTLIQLCEAFTQRLANTASNAREVSDIPSALAYIIGRVQDLDQQHFCLSYFLGLPNDMYRIAVHAVRIMGSLSDTLTDSQFYALENKIIKSNDASAAAAAFQIATQYTRIANMDGLIECIERNATPAVASGMIATIRSMDIDDQLGVVASQCHEFRIST